MPRELYQDSLDRLAREMSRLSDLVERQGLSALGLGGATNTGPEAFGVVSLGKGQGFGTLDQTGAGFSGEFFAERQAANTFADAHRRLFDNLAARLAPAPTAAQAAPLGRAVAAAVGIRPISAATALGIPDLATTLGRRPAAIPLPSPLAALASRGPIPLPAPDRFAAFRASPPPAERLADPLARYSGWAKPSDPAAPRPPSAFEIRQRWDAQRRAVPPGQGLVPVGAVGGGGSGQGLGRWHQADPVGRDRLLAAVDPIRVRVGSWGGRGLGGDGAALGSWGRPIELTDQSGAAAGRKVGGRAWRPRASAVARRMGRTYAPFQRASQWAQRHMPGGRGAQRAAGFAVRAAGVATSLGRNAGMIGRVAGVAAQGLGLGARGAGMVAMGGAAVAGALAPVAAFGAAVAAVTALGAASLYTATKLREFSEAQSASNRGLGRFNREISAAFQVSDRNELFRQTDFARATAGTAVTLARGVDRARDAWAPIDTLGQNVMNRVGIFASGVSGQFAKELAPLAKMLGVALDKADPNGENMLALGASTTAFAASWLKDPGRNALLAGAPARQAAADAAGQAIKDARAKAVGANRWEDGINTLVKGGPIRGPREMPRF